MTSLFERAVGTGWDELHPQIRERYGLSTDDRVAIGTGRMSQLTHNVLALPVLWLGTTQNFLFPESGTDIPFEIRSEAFIDTDGNEALRLQRRFETDPPRRFDDTMRWNPERECITEFLGRDGRIVADIHLSVADGGLVIEIGEQWIRFGDRFISVPAPLAVNAVLQDWYDEYAGRFRVAASITNPLAGHVFGYQGVFDNEWRDETPTDDTDEPVRHSSLPSGPQ